MPAIISCRNAKPFRFVVTSATVTLSILVLLVTSVIDRAAAILVEPADNAKYQIQWTWDPDTSSSIGLIKPKIRIADESSHKIVGYVADENGTRLAMYNDEQIVMTKYYLKDGFTSDWEIADRPYKGYFAVSIPPEFVGRVESIKIFINNHMYPVNDGTVTTSQSWIFINSAYTVHKLGSLIHLGPLTLGFEELLPNAAIPIAGDGDLKGNDKFDVQVYDEAPPIFLSPLRNVIVKFDDGLPIVWYEPPIASDFGDEGSSMICNPSPGSVFNFGTNIVKCLATYDSENAAYSYFALEVAVDPDARSQNPLTQAQIDIDPFYPGSNTVQLRYTTLVSIALFGNASLNVREVNQNALQFGPNGALPATSTGSYLTDVNADGFSDLILEFDVLKAGLYEGYHGNACLIGILDDGETAFEGCDTVEVVIK